MLTLLIDTREQAPLDFPEVLNCSVRREGLRVGDYSAEYLPGLNIKLDTVFERKSIADLFGSYTNNYEAEKAKIKRAKELNLRFILAIEGTVTEVLRGHSYWKDGARHEAKKLGISMLRQLITMSQKYDFDVMYFNSRNEMALFIQEFYLAPLRWQIEAK